MTQRKAPAPRTGINPKLAAIAAKLDAAKVNLANLEVLESNEDDDRAIAAADGIALKLELQLANTAATSLEELKLKARYVGFSIINEAPELTDSIIRDLHALSPPRPERR
jgi:hypothetical protein